MLLEDKVVMVSGVGPGLGIKLALTGNSMPTAAKSCTEEEGR